MADLPAFVDFMRNNEKIWSTVMETMQRVMPGLADIRTAFTEDRRVSLRFVEDGVGRPWTADEVSDGTIQTLAMLAALFDPRTRFVTFEEPENSVHPWILRNFIEACRAADKQVLITTHSPTLINRLEPSEVVVVARDRGETSARPLLDLDPDAERVWSEGHALLFEILDTGSVPQAVPGAG